MFVVVLFQNTARGGVLPSREERWLQETAVQRREWSDWSNPNLVWFHWILFYSQFKNIILRTSFEHIYFQSEPQHLKNTYKITYCISFTQHIIKNIYIIIYFLSLLLITFIANKVLFNLGALIPQITFTCWSIPCVFDSLKAKRRSACQPSTWVTPSWAAASWACPTPCPTLASSSSRE